MDKKLFPIELIASTLRNGTVEEKRAMLPLLYIHEDNVGDLPNMDDKHTENLRLIHVLQSAFQALNTFEPTTLERAYVSSFAAGIFYWCELEDVTPSHFQLLPNALLGWAYLGYRCGASMITDLPGSMDDVFKNTLCAIDMNFLQQGNTHEALITLLLFFKEKSPEPACNEFYENNPWLQEISKYAVKSGIVEEQPKTMSQFLSLIFPAYSQQFRTWEAMDLAFGLAIEYLAADNGASLTAIPENLI